VVFRVIKVIFLAVIISLALGCRHVVTPKPRGHFRIDLPEKKYSLFDQTLNNTDRLPLSFEYPAYGNITFQGEFGSKPGWFNIEFPRYKAKIYLTYRDVHNNLDSILNQSYNLNVKNHVAKADAINEQVYSRPENKVYGILYDLKGNTASAVEFYVTDSTRHYLRGSLYFASEPDADSLSPVISFFRSDIVHLIETLKWK